MPTKKPVVAIAGATGSLGYYITEALLQPDTISNFSSIILLSRKSSSPQLDEWKQKGANVVVYSEDDLSKPLEGVDVLVNTIGSAGHHFKSLLLHALASPNSTVTLYIPSEFGVDHTIHPFPHPEWDAKKSHLALANSLLSSSATSRSHPLKITRIFPGLFLSHSIGPWFGFDTANNTYEAVGNPNAKATFTSLPDIGRTVAILAAMDPRTIPTELHISGSACSVNEIASIMSAAGAGPIDVTTINYDEYKDATIEEGTTNPAKYLRFLIGDGSIDHSEDGLGNQNEFVNPGLWKWTTMEDYAKETHGKPWADWKPK